MSGIGAKLFFIIGITILIFTSFLFYRTYDISNRYVKNVTETQVEMALQFDLSIRKYIAEKIRPLMYELVGEDEFIPEAMSTSFVARSIFEDVRIRFPNYILKFSSDDPRNPANLASRQELSFIDFFNKNPGQKSWGGNIIINDEEYYAKFHARRMEEPCLHCHGTPEDAPQSLLDRYGDKAGFHRPVGDVIALDTIAIPTKNIQEKLWNEITNNFLLIGTGLILLFIALFISVKLVVTNRLATITKHFSQASAQDDFVQIDLIDENGWSDEITSLTSSFNGLARKLSNYHNSIDKEIKEKLKAEKQLQQSNTTLEKILESTSPICITNTDFEILLANKAYYEIWPQIEGTTVPIKCYESRPGSLCKTDLCPLGKIINGEEEVIIDATKYIDNNDDLEFIVTARPFKDSDGKLIGIVENFQDITERKKLEDEKADLIEKLQASLEKVKLLSGFIPICSTCKKIRDDQGYWSQVESYIRDRSEAEFSHGICPECATKYYSELHKNLPNKK